MANEGAWENERAREEESPSIFPNKQGEIIIYDGSNYVQFWPSHAPPTPVEPKH